MSEAVGIRDEGAGKLWNGADRPALARLGILIALLGAYRVVTGNYALWFDEYATLIFADLPLHQLWSGWMVNETNPPLFYSLIKGWQLLGFHTVLGLRLLPVLFSMVALALIAAAAWLGWSRSAATSAVLIVGVSPHHVFFSQMLRGYMLASDGVLLSFLGLLLLVRIAECRPGEPRRTTRIALALYAGGAALAIYCHTTMLLWPPIAMVALAATLRSQLLARRGHLLRHLLVANLAIAALAGWWLGITFAQLKLGAQNVSWIRAHNLPKYLDMLGQSVMLVNQEYQIERSLVFIVAGALAASAVAGRRRPAMQLAFGVFMGGALTFWAVSLIHPIATKYTVFWLLPFTALIIVGGLSTLRNPERERQLRLGLVAVIAANLVMHGAELAYQPFAETLRIAARDPGTGLLVEGATMGAVSTKACQLEFPSTLCPVPIVTLKLGRGETSWATALGTVQTVTPAQLPQVLAVCCRAVYTVRTFDMDPLIAFQLRRQDQRYGWNNPFREGPVPATSFRPETYRVTEPYWYDLDQ